MALYCQYVLLTSCRHISHCTKCYFGRIPENKQGRVTETSLRAQANKSRAPKSQHQRFPVVLAAYLQRQVQSRELTHAWSQLQQVSFVSRHQPFSLPVHLLIYSVARYALTWCGCLCCVTVTSDSSFQCCIPVLAYMQLNHAIINIEGVCLKWCSPQNILICRKLTLSPWWISFNAKRFWTRAAQKKAILSMCSEVVHSWGTVNASMCVCVCLFQTLESKLNYIWGRGRETIPEMAFYYFGQAFTYIGERK